MRERVGDASQKASQASDVVAGVGFRHAAKPEAITELIRQAFEAAGLPLARLHALATAADRASEPPLQAAAAGFGVPVLAVAAPALQAVDAAVVTRSRRIAAQRGVGSLAEAAALAAAGPGAVLVLPRLTVPTVTCALARIAGSL